MVYFKYLIKFLNLSKELKKAILTCIDSLSELEKLDYDDFCKHIRM